MYFVIIQIAIMKLFKINSLSLLCSPTSTKQIAVLIKATDSFVQIIAQLDSSLYTI